MRMAPPKETLTNRKEGHDSDERPISVPAKRIVTSFSSGFPTHSPRFLTPASAEIRVTSRALARSRLSCWSRCWCT
jgi:hypothetical protein